LKKFGDAGMTDFSKNRVLALYKILIRHTDEQHPISMQDILTYMEAEGHSCSEDSVLRYIKQLRNELGVDIISGRGRSARYFIGNRLLEKEELKLIIDSINSCNFIEKSIAAKMIDKLKSTMSIYDSEELDRSVLGVNIAKAQNKKILYNVNIIQEALARGVQISFDYMGWDKNKKLVKKSERRYNMNPWALIWANDRYYLYGYDVKKTGDVFNERNYRVDKLDNIQLSDISRDGKSQFRSFNANTYVSRRMGMFSGKEQAITVRIPEFLVGAFIDQFGKRITISEVSEDILLVTFHAVPSVILLGWLVGLKSAEVVGPQNVREDIFNLLQDNIDLYKKKN
jgi:predicted DNA-binding transcriptional regulator YafY